MTDKYNTKKLHTSLPGQYYVVSAGLIIMAALSCLNVALFTEYAAATTANTLKVAPVRIDSEVQPGTRKNIQITVTNVTESDILVRPVANDFVAGDRRGTPALILNENEYAPTRSLKRFLSPLSDMTIPPGEAKTLTVVITVPPDARPGGYFGAIRLMPAGADSGGQVNMSPSVASLILLTVTGSMSENLDLDEFSVRQNGQSRAYYYSPTNLQAFISFKNSGDVQLGPFGKVSVKKWDDVVYEADFNNLNPRDLVLPDSQRDWDVTLENIEGFGRYSVHGTFTYGQTNQTIEVNRIFWIIPWNTILVAGIVLLGLTACLIGLWALMHRRNKRRPSFTRSRHGGRYSRYRR